jgi:hypothetical protein
VTDECFEASYDVAEVVKNEGRQFKAKAR